MISVPACIFGRWVENCDIDDIEDLQWLYHFYYHEEYPFNVINALLVDWFNFRLNE